MSIGSKPSEWEAAVTADPSVLKSAASAKIARKILSTAGSRAPQKQLCSAIQGHLEEMVKDENGCSILSSLIEFGTKQSVASVLPTIMKTLNANSLTKSQAELVRLSTRRPGCSDEAAKAVDAVVKKLLSNLTLPNALSAVAALVGQDPKRLQQFKFVPAFKAASKAEKVLFVQASVCGAEDAIAVGFALWGMVGKLVDQDVAEVLAKIGGVVSDSVADYLVLNKKLADRQWAPVTAACIRKSSEDLANKITKIVLANEADPTVIGAVQARFPDRAFESPDVAAVATQWSRSHQSAFHRTRETITARISQKRSRDDAEEF